MPASSLKTQKLGVIKPDFLVIASETIQTLVKNIRSVIIISENKLEYIVAAKIAGGHVILADIHGVGKTSLARAFADSIEWAPEKKEMRSKKKDQKEKEEEIQVQKFQRIQCTVDLLPQDIIGFNYFNMAKNTYLFNPGPIFSHFLLCDEINLLTPKAQGAFFQAMEERSINIERTKYELPSSFFIIATMNIEGQHLFPLPLPQLDRFIIQLSLNYPNEEAEYSIIERHALENSWQNLVPVVKESELIAWTKLVDRVTISPDVIRYIVSILQASRKYPGVKVALSPRAGIRMSRLSRALAVVRGKDYVDIDLIKELAKPTFAHRLELENTEMSKEDVIQSIVDSIKIY